MIFHKKKNTIINCEWDLLGGGFLHIGKMNWIVAWRFAKKGAAFLGQEKEFLGRVEFAVDHEPKFSWFTLEMVNPFEARWLYLWFRIWPGHNLKLVINLGWRLTRASRDYLDRQVMEYERRMTKQMKEQQQNGGKPNATVIR